MSSLSLYRISDHTKVENESTLSSDIYFIAKSFFCDFNDTVTQTISKIATAREIFKFNLFALAKVSRNEIPLSKISRDIYMPILPLIHMPPTPGYIPIISCCQTGVSLSCFLKTLYKNKLCFLGNYSQNFRNFLILKHWL